MLPFIACLATQAALICGTRKMIQGPLLDLNDIKACRREHNYAGGLDGGHLEATVAEVKIGGTIAMAAGLSALLWSQLA